MTLRLFIAAVLCVGATLAHAAFDLDTLMAGLAQHPGGRAQFVEKRYLALLDQPVVAKGEMIYTAPGRLEKRTLEPSPETLVLDGDTLQLERGRRKMTIQLASRPEALAFVDSIRGTLAGNRQALEKNYTLQLSGRRDEWVLTLLPVQPQIAGLLRQITVTGQGGQVRGIEYLQADGDRSVLSIQPIAAP